MGPPPFPPFSPRPIDLDDWVTIVLFSEVIEYPPLD